MSADASAASSVPEGATLAAAARSVLECPDADGKAKIAHEVAALWRAGALIVTPGDMPDRPRRPGRPCLLPPNEMPRRTFKGERGRFALLHSLAHIELNAIDLAFDMAGRFSGDALPRDFFDDWIRIGDEEALHFTLIQKRLASMDGTYGDLPAHDGLWQAAYETRHDLLARLAIVPMVLEARGLDVTPAMIVRLAEAGDHDSARTLEIIYRDEQQHVGAGVRWFRYLCGARGLDCEDTFHILVRRHFRGALKPPFNVEARDRAGFGRRFYEPLSAG